MADKGLNYYLFLARDGKEVWEDGKMEATGLTFVSSGESVIILELTHFCLNPDPIPQENILPSTVLYSS